MAAKDVTVREMSESALAEELLELRKAHYALLERVKFYERERDEVRERLGRLLRRI
jgi:hypothetical protein